MTEEEVRSVIAHKKEEYEDAPEPKMRKEIFYALMETYEKYHQAFKNLKDR